MLDSFLAWFQGLPPVGVYAAVFVFAALENLFPHPPSDLVIAWSAFLAGRGLLNPRVVFGSAWLGNVVAAESIYLFARRYGRGRLRARWRKGGRSAVAAAKVGASVSRYGSYGVFLMRLLPVWRGVVPPVAGVVGIPPGPALVAIGSASALWYGALVLLAAEIGTNFDSVRHVLAHANVVLVALGVILLGAILAVIGVAIRRSPREGRESIVDDHPGPSE